MKKFEECMRYCCWIGLFCCWLLAACSTAQPPEMLSEISGVWTEGTANSMIYLNLAGHQKTFAMATGPGVVYPADIVSIDKDEHILTINVSFPGRNGEEFSVRPYVFRQIGQGGESHLVMTAPTGRQASLSFVRRLTSTELAAQPTQFAMAAASPAPAVGTRPAAPGASTHAPGATAPAAPANAAPSGARATSPVATAPVLPVAPPQGAAIAPARLAQSAPPAAAPARPAHRAPPVQKRRAVVVNRRPARMPPVVAAASPIPQVQPAPSPAITQPVRPGANRAHAGQPKRERSRTRPATAAQGQAGPLHAQGCSAGNPQQVHACAAGRFRRADQLLNQRFQQVMAGLPPARRQGLAHAEVQWILRKRARCASHARATAGGEWRQRTAQLQCWTEMTQARTAQLMQGR